MPGCRDAYDVAATGMDHEEDIERPEEDRSNAEQSRRPK
jgi:hypothetical protein